MANDVPSGAPVVNAAGITDTGRVRPINEDAFSYQQPTDPNEAATKGNLYVVTDGMGGMNAGDLASEIAVESITQNYYASDATSPRDALEEAVQIANGRVLSEALNRNLREKMGATVVALVLQGDHYVIANAGNSRGYLVRDGAIQQLTVDHSWAAEKLAQGMSRDQIQADPRRNAVTRALGIKQEVRVDFGEGQTQAGDIFVLCTDGLTGAVSDETIKEIVTSNPPNIAVDRLKQAAIDANTSDNIAVLVADVESVPGGAALPAEAGAAGAMLAATQPQDGNAVQESVPAVPRPRNRLRTGGQQAAVAGAAAAGAEVVASSDDTGDTTRSKVKSKTKTSGQQAVVAAPAATQAGEGEPPDGNEPDAENDEADDEEATGSRGGVSPWLLIAAVIIVGILLGLVIRGIFFPQQPSGTPVAGGVVSSPTVKAGVPGATSGATTPVTGQSTTPGAQATKPAGVPTTTVSAPPGPATTPTPGQAVPSGPPTAAPAAPTATPGQAAPPSPAAPTATSAPPVVPPPAAPTATPAPQRFAVIAATSGGGVNIRQQPTTASAILGSIPNGARVAIITTVQGQALAPNNPDWYQVSFNGITGYIYSNTVRVEQ